MGLVRFPQSQAPTIVRERPRRGFHGQMGGSDNLAAIIAMMNMMQQGQLGQEQLRLREDALEHTQAIERQGAISSVITETKGGTVDAAIQSQRKKFAQSQDKFLVQSEESVRAGRLAPNSRLLERKIRGLARLTDQDRIGENIKSLGPLIARTVKAETDPLRKMGMAQRVVPAFERLMSSNRLNDRNMELLSGLIGNVLPGFVRLSDPNLVTAEVQRIYQRRQEAFNAHEADLIGQFQGAVNQAREMGGEDLPAVRRFLSQKAKEIVSGTKFTPTDIAPRVPADEELFRLEADLTYPTKGAPAAAGAALQEAWRGAGEFFKGRPGEGIYSPGGMGPPRTGGVIPQGGPPTPTPVGMGVTPGGRAFPPQTAPKVPTKSDTANRMQTQSKGMVHGDIPLVVLEERPRETHPSLGDTPLPPYLPVELIGQTPTSVGQQIDALMAPMPSPSPMMGPPHTPPVSSSGTGPYARPFGTQEQIRLLDRAAPQRPMELEDVLQLWERLGVE